MFPKAILLLGLASQVVFAAPVVGEIGPRALHAVTQVVYRTVTSTATRTVITDCPSENPFTNLPSGLFPSGFSLPPDFSLPTGFSFPSGAFPTNFPLPSGFSWPAGFSLPSGAFPTAFPLPSGFSLPSVILPTGLPSSISIPTTIPLTGPPTHLPTTTTASGEGWPFGFPIPFPMPTGFPFGWFKLAARSHKHCHGDEDLVITSHVTATVTATTTQCNWVPVSSESGFPWPWAR